MKKGLVCQHFRLECCIVENIQKSLFQIARKLLNRIRYVLKNQAEYVPAVIE